MDRRHFLLTGAAVGAASFVDLTAQTNGASAAKDDRASWVEILTRVAHPVLAALSARELKKRMRVEAPHGNAEDRRQFTYLEAFGRLLAGIAPWLQCAPSSQGEETLRRHYAELSREALDAATDPRSPDFMNFSRGAQPVVDTAFLALGILRAPAELWNKVEDRVRRNTIAALESSRTILPGYNNWLLFSAMVEAALSCMGAQWDKMRVDYAIRTVNSWYLGDGIYGDGPELHCDFYNSFVMQPMLLNLVDAVSTKTTAWQQFAPAIVERARRYAAIQERLIGPDGSFPPIGRSLSYRFGAFHLLAEMALRRQLPDDVSPGQVRSALTAVMRRMIDAPGTFDESGWLQVGFCGHQPEMAEAYISTGSCYLCSAAWLPLGLPASDAFWAEASKPWTSKKAWSGQEFPADAALGAHGKGSVSRL